MIGMNAAEPPAKPNKEMQMVLDELTALGGKPMETLSAEEARKQPTPADAVKALLQKQGKSVEPEPVGKVEDIMVTGADGKELPARVYSPKGEGPFPTILYIHGGGWVIADLDTYDASPRAIANAANAVVVSTHYRQAPENKFPAAHEDTFAVYQWLLKNAERYQGDPTKMAVVGESAGGNMAAAIALMAKSQGAKMPLHQVLVYPVAAHDFETPSYHANEKSKPLNSSMMKWFFDNELKSERDGESPFISLAAKASMEGLPSTTIIAAEIDPLLSEGKMLAEKLEQSGVKVRYRQYNGVAHEFFGMGAVLKESKDAVAFAAEGLKEAFTKTVTSVGKSPVGESGIADQPAK